MDNTHVVFNGQSITISPNLREIVTFINELDTEIIRLLVDSPHTVRANIITLFAYLETLYCLKISYQFEISDKKSIIQHSRNPEERLTFYNDFLVNPQIPWCRQNIERLKYINATKMVELRNNLTHFFSVGKHIQLAPSDQDKISRETEVQTEYKIIFLSPLDLYNLVRGTGLLLIDMWTKGYHQSVVDKGFDYKKKMLHVHTLVMEHGAVTLHKSSKD